MAPEDRVMLRQKAELHRHEQLKALGVEDTLYPKFKPPMEPIEVLKAQIGHGQSKGNEPKEDSKTQNTLKKTNISQLKSGALGARTIDEGAMDEKSGMNFSEYMAILSGNTDLLDKAKLDKKIASLEGERKSFNRGKRDSELKLKSKSEELDGNRTILKGMTADYDKFMSQAKKDKDGNILNLITIEKEIQ